jgi:deoxyribonuclease V
VGVVITKLHDWPKAMKHAKALQEELRGRVEARPLHRRLRVVAGAVVVQDRGADRLFAAAVAVHADTLEVVETASHVGPATFPMVPGFLAFREVPVLLEALAKLRVTPDLVISDRHGYAHPRRLGMASHLGLWLGVPTVGCCPQLVMGEARPVRSEPGSTSPVVDEENGEVVGMAVRTAAGADPLYVSVGHLVTLPEAAALVMAQCKLKRLPPCLRAAYLLTVRLRRAVASLDPETAALLRQGS